VRAAGEYDLVPFARTALASMTPQSEGACMSAALDDAEAGEAAYRAAAVGWARGDVAAALKAPRQFDRCLLLMAGGPELWRRSTDDLAEAIDKALKTPGHAVATVSLRRLLAKDGLVDTLKARGLTVIGPNDP
jgi:DNA-binding GntR family transcriptional regulator